jgi:hypothetical protein
VTIRSTVHATTLSVALIMAGSGSESVAHEIAGVQSYYACQPTLARAFLRSPNPGAGRRDYPLAVLDTDGNATGEHIVVFTVENASAFDARVTAVGFAWPAQAGRFELVQLHRGYNELTTDNAGVRSGSIGPTDFTVVATFGISQSHGDVEFSVRQDIHGVPGFPHTVLNVALVTGNAFAGGQPGGGLATDGVRHVIAIKGVLPKGLNGLPDIEELLNDSYVRFRQVDSDGDGAETGIWRNLLPPVSCS